MVRRRCTYKLQVYNSIAFEAVTSNNSKTIIIIINIIIITIRTLCARRHGLLIIAKSIFMRTYDVCNIIYNII